MRPEDRDVGLLWDMRKYADEALELASTRSLAIIEANPKESYELRYVLLVIGEAASHASDPFQKAHSEIDWANIVGARNILVHDYRHTRNDLVWAMATEHAPALVSAINSIIEANPPLSE